MEGASEVRFSGKGRLRMKTSGQVEKTVEAPAGALFSVRVNASVPAKLKVRVQLAEFPFADKAGLAAAQKDWQKKGLKVRAHVLGSIYGISGKVIDNRRYLLLVDETLTGEAATRRQAELLKAFSVRTSLFEELDSAPTGVVEILDGAGASIALSEGAVKVEPLGAEPIAVQRVEFGVGYDFHGFEDRTFRGSLEVTLDRNGKLAVVNRVALEDLLNGLVPSEIFASAPAEALKAQAVTARGEVLAKVGLKHLADPYLLCSEQHCAVYKGLSGEVASTNAAVLATAGQALFSSKGVLVDSVYSAVCGGHSENNDVVWGGPPNPSLRGRPDLITPVKGAPTPAKLSQFLAADLPAACKISSFAKATKYRWEKRFTAAELDEKTRDLKVGQVMAMAVTERGVSGRARLLTISGTEGATQVRGELNIRRLFGMLNSAMFEVSPEKVTGKTVGWLFKGGGWGHGVGMCQTGAIGRAEAGQSYQDILRHYYNGAEAARIY